VKIILRADVATVGKRGDICVVADGYARNYLLPKGLAIVASDGAVNQAAAMRRARDIKDASDRASAEEVARVLVSRTIVISARAGTEGRLFGSVTATDVADAVADQAGITIDRRAVQLHDPIKAVGSYQVPVKLHTDVQFPVTLEVTPSSV
jgi:large subunit ribosomal protein L9